MVPRSSTGAAAWVTGLPAGAVRADRAVLSETGQWPPPVGVERILLICLLQLWFNLSDSAVEEALYDSQAMACHESTDGRRSHRSCRARGTAPQLVFQPQWSKVGGSPLRVRTSTSSWLIFRGARHCASAPVCGGNGAWLNNFQDRRFNGIVENRQFLDLMGGQLIGL